MLHRFISRPSLGFLALAIPLLAACGATSEPGTGDAAGPNPGDVAGDTVAEADGAPVEDVPATGNDATPEPNEDGGAGEDTATVPDSDGPLDTGEEPDTDAPDIDADETDLAGEDIDTAGGDGCGDEPPTGCYSADGCEEGEVCEIVEGGGCLPSVCDCDAATDTWACTRDCAPGVCIQKPNECEGPNPAGCVATGCEPGDVCSVFPAGPCVPSACSCDTATGSWVCTADCGGGVCVPDGATPCATDADCTPGAQWCEENACVDCDNSALLCRIACPEGTGLVTRNECHPCVCEADNACLSDGDCGPSQRCEPGDDCLDWCPDGDPSCCYGNTCVERTE
jgi:hypothetical protein